MADRRSWFSPVLFLGLAVTLAVAGVASVVLVTVDNSAAARLPSGTIIEDVPVGGLDFDTAVVRVKEVVEDPLRRPLVITAERFKAITSAWDLGYRVDVQATVRTALLRSSDGNVLTRLGARLLKPTEPAFVSAPPEWVAGELDALLSRAAQAVSEAPQNADIDLSSGFVRFTPEKAGRVLDVEASRRAIMAAAETGDGSVRLVTRPVAPEEGGPAIDKVILVRTGENRLYLYDKGAMVKSWPIATGSAGYPTPTGIYRIISKIENPSWYNPGSSWARGMPAVIGPGPNNPLGTKALELDAPGILIHATPDRGSIGYSVSHGCIRMTEENEAELFELVPEGTRVAIVEAGPPRPRPARPVAPTPDAAAAVLF